MDKSTKELVERALNVWLKQNSNPAPKTGPTPRPSPGADRTYCDAYRKNRGEVDSVPPSEKASSLGKSLRQTIEEIESTPEGKAEMDEARRETDMEVRIAELEEEVAKWKNQAEVCEAALETLSREEIAASRMYELEEQGVALICGTEAAERQYSRIRKMTDEQFAEYKKELVAVRALIPADEKSKPGMAFNGHEWYPADEKSKPGITETPSSLTEDRIREIVRTEIEATKIYETVWKDTPTYQTLSKRTGTPEIRENLKLVPTADTNVRAE